MSPAGRRPVLFALPLLGLLGYGGYALSRHEFRDDRAAGRAAAVAGNWAAADAHAARLDRAGATDDARLVRGLTWVGRARKLPPGADQSNALRAALAHLGRVRTPGAATEATVLAAECLIRLGEPQFAEDALQATVRTAPDTADAHRWLAAIYIDLNTPVTAAYHLSEWGRLETSAGRPYRWAGFFYKTADQPAPAVAAYRAALDRDLDPAARADAARELAEVLLDSLEDHAGALAALGEAPPAARGRPEFGVLRAAALWGLGRHDEAITTADAALLAAPDSAAALRLRGQFYLHRDDSRAARPLLERAAALAPHDLGVLKKLTEACEQAGDRAAADAHRKAFDRAAALRERMTRLYTEAEQRPWDPAPRRAAADVCRDLGRPVEARMWARAATACDPADPAARELLAALGDGSGAGPAESFRLPSTRDGRP